MLSAPAIGFEQLGDEPAGEIRDSSDGVRSHSFAFGYSPRVAKSTDGKLWFLPFDGVSVVTDRVSMFMMRKPSPSGPNER